MVVMMIPEEESNIMNEVRQAIKSKLIEFANDKDINWIFINDSIAIENAITKIEDAMARICTKVKKDRDRIKIKR